MDAIVMQAMAKWPNVPHCYGWLALDARGNWRMRDERAQAENLPGDRIMQVALIAFIQRNYARDDAGRWYFQNGPQRVYVTLEMTPFIARSDPQHGFVLHTGTVANRIEAAWLTPSGELILSSPEWVAAVDDRDVASCLEALRLDGALVGDDRLLAWLSDRADRARLTFQWRGQDLPVTRIEHEALPEHFAFIAEPRPEPSEPVA